jgi:hypothetical protein
MGEVAADLSKSLKKLAGTTGLEPAASAVTGQRSNQLNYVPSFFGNNKIQAPSVGQTMYLNNLISLSDDCSLVIFHGFSRRQSWLRYRL